MTYDFNFRPSFRGRGGNNKVVTTDWIDEEKGISLGLAGLDVDSRVPEANLPVSRAPAWRKRPNRLTMQTTFATGHGWTANVGTWTADTADYILGSQSIRTTTNGAGLANTYRKLAQPALDLSGKNFAMLVKVDAPTALSQINLYLGSASLANFYVLTHGKGGTSANSTLQPGVWTWVYFSWADVTSQAGAPAKTNITDWQLRVVDTNTATPITFWCNAIAYYDKPTTYPTGVVSIAFDDNYDNQFTAARPILDAYGLGATAFTIVDILGTSGKMTEAQLNQLQDIHGWEVAGHAYTTAAHNAGFPTLTTAALDAELQNLKGWLVRNGHKGADLFAYPLGADNADVVQSVGNYFTLARQIVRTPLQLTHIDQPLRLRAYSVSQSDTLVGMQAVVDKAKADGAWLVFTFHRITPTAVAGTEWPTADFQALINYIAAQNMPIETMGSVLDRLRAS